MKIVIVGAGFTGVQLAKLLINEKNQVALIDNNEDTIRHAQNQLDCTVLCADGNNLETLESVGIHKADALVCVTSSDEVNMITCSLVDAVYPDVLKIARVRNYAYYVNTAAAEKKHGDSFGSNHRPLYGINYMINPDVEAAESIVKAIENGAVGNVLTFDNSDLEIARITVNEKSIFRDVSLKEIRTKTDIKFLVVYVEKEGKTSLPSGDTKIEAGDILGVLVSKEQLVPLMELCGTKAKELRRVALIGAGRIGTIVAEKFLNPQKEAEAAGNQGQKGFLKRLTSYVGRKTQDFVIIDSNDILAKNASEKFPQARVMCADASDENFLREEGITSYDLAICATHNHELNMVLAAYLESLGVGQTISLVTSSAFETIAVKLGVDVPIALRDAVVDSIMSHLRGKSVKEIHTVTNGQMEIVECEIGGESKVNGKALKEISNPGLFLVLLCRQSGIEEYKIVDGNTRLYAGDHVVIIVSAEQSKKVLSYFAGADGE